MLFIYFILYNKRCRIRRKQFLVLFSLINQQLIYQKNRENIKAQVQFRHDLLESQKRINYHNEFDRLQGAKKLSGLDPHVNTIKRTAKEGKAIIERRRTTSSYLFY